MITETTEGSNPHLESLRALSLVQFRGRYSTYDLPEMKGVGLHEVYATTSEHSYPEMLDKITVNGGLHLAVAGGLDPSFGQVAKAHPDFTVLFDINPYAVPMIDSRLRLLDQAESGTQYWKLLEELLRADPRFRSSIPYAPFESMQDDGGWSSSRKFPAVKKAWQEGRIKFVESDIMTSGIETGMMIAKDSGIPITLIYLSNILDHPGNKLNLERFKQNLRKGLSNRAIDPGSQIVTASVFSIPYMQHQVVPVKEFAGQKKV